MGVDRSKEFTMEDVKIFKGKPNRRCPHCGKITIYKGGKLFCPNCGKRYSRYTITNSEGVREGMN